MITDRESLLAFLTEVGEVNAPMLECEFSLVINFADGGLQDVILAGFSLPDSGISFSNDASNLGFVIPSFNISALDVSFYSKSPTKEDSPMHKWYFSQFSDDGLLKNADAFNVGVSIVANIGNEKVTLMKFGGCKVSYPIPSVSPKSATFSVFNSKLYYSNFSYGDN